MFSSPKSPPIVPDVFLSLDVEAAADLWAKQSRSYLIWVFEKYPEVVVEIVTNREGGENSEKRIAYERMRIPFYVIYDPQELLHIGKLLILAYRDGSYAPIEGPWLPTVGLGIKLWDGVFEGEHAHWLRWCDQDGNVIPTGVERAEVAEERANALAAKLRALGVDPEQP